MKAAFFMAFAVLAACTHRPPPHYGNTLFPEGTYKHAVRIQIKDQAPYPASGVLRIDRDSLKLFLLGPMDVTVFKITETFADGKIEFENHLPQLKEHESRIENVYDIVRAFLLYPRDQERWGPLKTVHKNAAQYPEILKGPRDIAFRVNEFKDDHPTNFTVEHTQFSINVTEIK